MTHHARTRALRFSIVALSLGTALVRYIRSLGPK
jgi:hypothetical protein